MTTVEVGDEGASGLTAVVVAVVEILLDALEREAIRRMESGTLTDEEIDRLGRHLATLEADLERMKEEQEVDEEVDRLRGDLDSLVTDALHQVDTDGRPRTTGRTGPSANAGGTDE
ncbi:gas vesicle protein K [Halogeometricum limi]|uniref:Gas vesicle protein K n=1 Tax=Halogeometricum limi TaxID=555875 RepID=A0A1I6GU45_9EURY|nr:gas vesicle protein K [Halogeometricum limi]SFR45793.1 Gas vesicle protein K [Halogeometricum limi]